MKRTQFSSDLGFAKKFRISFMKNREFAEKISIIAVPIKY